MRMRPSLFFASLFASLVALNASCVSRDYNTDAETMVVGGTVVPNNKYPGLVQLKSLQCSGVKIGPNHILTARHCVKFARTQDNLVIAHIPATARSGARSALEEIQTRIVNVVKHPDTDTAKNIDLAIVEIEASASFSALATAQLEDDSAQNGDRVNVVGFGCTERSDFSDGMALNQGTVQVRGRATPAPSPTPSRSASAGTSPTETTCSAIVSGSTELSTGTNLACQMATTSNFQSVPGLCYGDSGGPLYSGSAPYRVVGINSNFRPGELAGVRMASPPSTRPNTSGRLTPSSIPRYGVSKFVRVDAGVSVHQDWIRNTLRRRTRP